MEPGCRKEQRSEPALPGKKAMGEHIRPTDEMIEAHMGLHDTIDRLRSTNAELLETCKGLVETIEEWYVNSDEEIDSFLEPYKAAIARAEEEK